MSKRGLPLGVQMRHDEHYVDTLGTPISTIGRKIAIDLIEPNPEQPRTEFGDLTDLTASIKEKGVLEPLLVKPIPATGKWMIIAGERRWRSAKLAGLNEVPCIEMDVDQHGIAEIALVENLQRKDLTVWEEADGLSALAARFEYTQDQISKKISKSRTTVTELLTIAGLPADIRERCVESGVATKAALLEIARQFDTAAMHSHLDALIGGKKTSRSGAPSETKNVKQPIAGEASLSDDDKVFRFSAEDGSFGLQIHFQDGGGSSRKRVLKALKTTFDAVKASE